MKGVGIFTYKKEKEVFSESLYRLFSFLMEE